MDYVHRVSPDIVERTTTNQRYCNELQEKERWQQRVYRHKFIPFPAATTRPDVRSLKNSVNTRERSLIFLKTKHLLILLKKTKRKLIKY